MSEYHSLYLRVPIKEKALNSFLQSTIHRSLLDSDWLAWWASREMVSKYELIEVPIFPQVCYQDVVEIMLKDKSLISKQNYNPVTEVWELISLQYSENYIEILPLIAMTKALAKFTTPKATGSAILFDYLWGDRNVMAFLHIENQQANLAPYQRVSEVPLPIIETARSALGQLMDDFKP